MKLTIRLYFVIITTLGFLLPIETSAQTGYLGKRLDIQYTPTLGINLNYYNQFFDLLAPNLGPITKHPDARIGILNIKHELQLNFMVLPKLSLGVGYNSFKAGLNTSYNKTSSLNSNDLSFRLTLFDNSTQIGNFISIGAGKSDLTLDFFDGTTSSSTYEGRVYFIDFGKQILIKSNLFLRFGGKIQYSLYIKEGANIKWLSSRATVGIGYILF